MLQQSRQRARHGDTRGIGVGFSENDGQLLIVVLELEPPDDGFAIGRTQLLQRRLVPFHTLPADGDVERRSRIRRVAVVRDRRRGTAGEPARFVSDSIEDGLPQVRLKGALVT